VVKTLCCKPPVLWDLFLLADVPLLNVPSVTSVKAKQLNSTVAIVDLLMMIVHFRLLTRQTMNLSFIFLLVLEYSVYIKCCVC